MSRLSRDELAADGTIHNGYDYNIQVWVRNGICTDVGSGSQWVGTPIAAVPGHEDRSGEVTP